ncbi:MAG: ATP-binding protein, partial [Bacteroidales bacterium]|nr:ATP-binding protein [Bacteroidales bacterium]
MITESQNIEFKESWRDEYQKWICGFANAQGGTLYIGVQDDGEVCGVQDAKKLMEDIPNKVRDMMGILVEVNLEEKDEKKYLEIVTEAYPYPISFRGKYYQRSGATNQELKGAALDRFMLRRQGKTWDGVPVPYLKAEDLDNTTFDLFRKYAKRSGRMDDADLIDDNHGLLEKLRLYEGNYLKRATALLFHPDPELYVTGAYVKVGFFREGMDLVYQDEIHGNLFQQIAKLMDLLCTKYLKAIITYEGIHRIETLPIPREALREALLNACINKDYASNAPIQIRVYENKLEIINSGVLPDGWTVNTLLSSHGSHPYNPSIANTFFRSGEIEAWGRGIERIITACKNEGFSTPDFRYDASGIWMTFKFEYPERATIQDRSETIQKT